MPQWRSRRRGATALSVLAVVAIGAGACGGSGPTTAASSPATAGSGLHFPAHLLGLNKNTSPKAQALNRALTSVFAGEQSDFRGPQAVIYGDFTGSGAARSPSDWMYGATLSSAAARSAGPAFDKAFAAGFAKSTGITNLQAFPAGPHGGALDCGHGTIHGVTAFACGWADKVTVGGVLYFGGSASSLSDAASKTNQVRSTVER